MKRGLHVAAVEYAAIWSMADGATKGTRAGDDRGRLGGEGGRSITRVETGVIELADQDILDIARSRATEQEVLDLLDEPPTPVRSGLLTWGLAAKRRPVVIVSREDPDHHDLSSYTCLSPRSGEAVPMKCR
jgi:hypothetical protein